MATYLLSLSSSSLYWDGSILSQTNSISQLLMQMEVAKKMGVEVTEYNFWKAL